MTKVILVCTECGYRSEERPLSRRERGKEPRETAITFLKCPKCKSAKMKIVRD